MGRCVRHLKKKHIQLNVYVRFSVPHLTACKRKNKKKHEIWLLLFHLIFSFRKKNLIISKMKAILLVIRGKNCTNWENQRQMLDYFVNQENGEHATHATHAINEWIYLLANQNSNAWVRREERVINDCENRKLNRCNRCHFMNGYILCRKQRARTKMRTARWFDTATN